MDSSGSRQSSRVQNKKAVRDFGRQPCLHVERMGTIPFYLISKKNASHETSNVLCTHQDTKRTFQRLVVTSVQSRIPLSDLFCLQHTEQEPEVSMRSQH
jgi:hypothetical protein